MDYRPFIDPLSVALPGLHTWWLVLLVPLALFLSVAYKAVRIEVFEVGVYVRQVAVMTVQVIAGMLMLGAVVFAIVQWIAPLLVPLPA